MLLRLKYCGFDSVLHGNDCEESYLDLLVEPLPDTTLMDIARIQNRLQKLTNVPLADPIV